MWQNNIWIKKQRSSFYQTSAYHEITVLPCCPNGVTRVVQQTINVALTASIGRKVNSTIPSAIPKALNVFARAERCSRPHLPHVRFRKQTRHSIVSEIFTRCFQSVASTMGKEGRKGEKLLHVNVHMYQYTLPFKSFETIVTSICSKSGKN